MTDDRKERLRDIIAKRSFSTGREFALASGVSSNYYFDMKPTMLDPDGVNLLAELILEATEDVEFDAVGGLAYGAIPIVTAVVQKSAQAGRPVNGFYVRKEQKTRGAEKLIDGIFEPGCRALVVEDVTTKGGSSFKAVEAIRAQGGQVDTVVVIVDRLEGAEAFLAENHLRLISILTRDDFDGIAG